MAYIAQWNGATWHKIRSRVDPIVHLSRSEHRARVDARPCGDARPAARNVVRSGKRSRPMTTGQEALFFCICFAVAALLQFVVLLNFGDVLNL